MITIFYKKAMKRITILIVIILFWGNHLSAQEEERPFYYLQIGGQFQIGIPLEAMRQELTEPAFGGGGNILFQTRRGRPIFIGVEVNSLRYDSESLEYTEIVEGVAEDYRLKTNNNILLWHGMIRYKPFTASIFQPYFDGMFGFKTFFTRTRLLYLFDNEEDVVESYVDRSQTVLSYGAAAGVQIMVTSMPDIAIDLRCAYLAGGNATYFVRKEEDMGPYNDPIEAFEAATSPTSMLIPQIGITFQIGVQ